MSVYFVLIFFLIPEEYVCKQYSLRSALPLCQISKVMTKHSAVLQLHKASWSAGCSKRYSQRKAATPTQLSVAYLSPSFINSLTRDQLVNSNDSKLMKHCDSASLCGTRGLSGASMHKMKLHIATVRLVSLAENHSHLASNTSIPSGSTTTLCCVHIMVI